MAKTVSDCGGLKVSFMTKKDFDKLAPKNNTTKKTSSTKKGK